MQTFDVLVIGTGSAGATVAKTVRKAGKQVAILDKLPFGGTCSQRGCDPKKVLVGAAETIARTEQLAGKGIQGTATINWPDLIRFKKTFTDPIPEATEQKFTDLGIACFRGAASFVSTNEIQVSGQTLQADHIVLATGHRPQTLHIPGEHLLTDSTGFMELSVLPQELVMVGGGYIAFEFAHIAARAGARVTILHQGSRPLEGFDADLVALLVGVMRALGIFIVFDARVTAIDGEPGKLNVQYVREGKTHTASAEAVVHAAGRVPDVDELNLERGNVTLGKKGILVNEYLQSQSNPAVYACGDVADKGAPLTPLASYEGNIVAHNILNGNQKTYTDSPVPSAVFTVPTLASVGLTEEQVRDQGRPVQVLFQATTHWYTSRRINEPVSGFKLIVDKLTDQVLGAHLLGEGSDELINLFTLAMKHQITAQSLKDTLMAYPSHASNLRAMLASA